MASSPIPGKTTKIKIATRSKIIAVPVPGVLLSNNAAKPIKTNPKAPKLTESMIEPKINLPMSPASVCGKKKIQTYFDCVERIPFFLYSPKANLLEVH